MRFLLLNLGLLALALSSGSAVDSKKKGKVFSLFNIVTFKNEPCSTSPAGEGQEPKVGTCITSSECTTKGGSPGNPCAAGFGTCCIFALNASGSIVNQNGTYLRNPMFPKAYQKTDRVAYTVVKSEPDICQLRLDFEQFDISESANRVCTAAIFSVKEIKTGASVPPLCGLIKDQHIYVDIGSDEKDGAVLSFDFVAVTPPTDAYASIWEILVQQISCSSRYRAPSGCLQYLTGAMGQITTFNYDKAGLLTEVTLGLNYNVCIRQEEGMCCVKYSQCSPDEFPFEIGANSATGMDVSATEESCTNDFVLIEGGSSNCQPGATLTNRYCGKFLNTFNGVSVGGQVCDCNAPFMVGIYTKPKVEAGQDSKGICLEYRQQPCGI